jgi:sortase A
VTVSTRIDPTQVEVIEDVPDKKLVTLITCGEASAVTRWMVQGELTEVTAVEQGSEAMLAAFQMEKKAY